MKTEWPDDADAECIALLRALMLASIQPAIRKITAVATKRTWRFYISME